MRLPQREVVEAAIARFVVFKQAKANGRAVLFFFAGLNALHGARFDFMIIFLIISICK